MKNSILVLLVAASGLLLTQCTDDTKPTEEQATDYAVSMDSSDSLCLVQPSWFPHSQTPPPAEGKGSPFDVQSTTNQIFHQWAYNKFLWLTKPDNNGNPLFLNTSDVKQVTSYMTSVTPPAGTLVQLQDINQAGSGSPILQTNADYGGSSEIVYYSIHMNELMYKNGIKFANQITSGKLSPSNVTTFPVGSFEMKVAWVPVAAIPDSKRSMYYTTTASLSADGGKTFTNTKVALVGMHVVGVVENHPEFIWATFEHDDLSVDYDWVSNAASSDADLLVYKKGTVTGIDGILYDTATKLGTTPYQVFDLFQYGVPRDNGGQFMATSQQEPVNFDNIHGINKCVQAQLDDVWKNYFYNGSIWLNMDGKTPLEQAQLIDTLGYNIGSATPGSSARGSLNCANVTMESFMQTFQTSINDINVTNLGNCFSCHSGVSFNKNKYTSPLYLSHTFQDYLENNKGNSVKEVEKLKSIHEDLIMKRLRK